MLISILIGNETVNVLSTIVIASIVVSVFPSEPWWKLTGIAVLTAAPIVLFFGEILPKSFAIRFPKLMLQLNAPLILIANKVFTPLRWLIDQFAGRVVPGHMEKSTVVREDEYLALVDASQEEGIIAKGERELIHSVFDFGDTLASDIMTPRTEIISVAMDSSVAKVLDLLKEHQFSRIPVYKGSKDNVVGVLFVKDLLRVLDEAHEVSIVDFVRPPFFVPLTIRADKLFRELKQKKQHMSLVVDEFGGIAGLVTMDDLLGELFGELRDEHDLEEWQFTKISDDEYTFSAKMGIGDFNRLMGANIHSENYQTIGGYLISLFDHIPEQGEQIRSDQFEWTVERIQGAHLIEVKVRTTGC